MLAKTDIHYSGSLTAYTTEGLILNDSVLALIGPLVKQECYILGIVLFLIFINAIVC